MATPILHWNLEAFSSEIVNSGLHVCITGVGDSKMTDSSTAGSFMFGLQSSLKSNLPIVGRLVRAEQGPPARAGTITVDGGQGTQYNTPSGTQNPTALTGGISAGAIWATNGSPTPIAAWTKIYTSNRDWFAPHEWKCALNGLTTYPDGDWTVGKHVMARVIYYAHGTSLPNAVIEGYRGASLANAQLVDMTANPGTVRYADVNCGAGAGTPEVRVRVSTVSSPNYDETGKQITILGVLFFVHDGVGNRTPGITLADISTGGLTAATMLSSLGAGASPRAVNARVREFLAIIRPTHFVVDEGQNLTAGQSTLLDAGNYAAYKAEVDAVVVELQSASASYGIAPKFLLCNPYATGYTATHNNAKGQALLEIAQARGLSYLNTYELFGRPPVAGNPGFTGDGIHPTENGSASWAGPVANLWYQVSFINGPKVRSRLR